MIIYTTGNLLDAKAEVLVNTVNTVGVMGKGIALMFKERFPKNMKEYALACKQAQVVTGKMFITETNELIGPRWIVNFPTKQDWRDKSQMEWIVLGLQDLRRFILQNNIASIAISLLGAGNGGLAWPAVKSKIEAALGDLDNIKIFIYEPTEEYHNVSKPTGVIQLTPARALIAELIRRYWVLGIECSLLEVQKLAWFLQRSMVKNNQENPLMLKFKANRYGPYAHNLHQLLNNMDGSYLKADKRIPDCTTFDVVWFDDSKKSHVQTYLQTEAKDYLPELNEVADLIQGFESPFGLELLATVDWLITEQRCQPELSAIKVGVAHWPTGETWAQRKIRLFSDRHLQYALDKLKGFSY